MTATLISLISIVIGIISANIFGVIYKKYSFGLIGNSISGVFGSILFIKSIGRLGFNPKAIMQLGEVDLVLLSINILISFLGGIIALFFISKLKKKMNKNNG